MIDSCPVPSVTRRVAVVLFCLLFLVCDSIPDAERFDGIIGGYHFPVTANLCSVGSSTRSAEPGAWPGRPGAAAISTRVLRSAREATCGM